MKFEYDVGKDPTKVPIEATPITNDPNVPDPALRVPTDSVVTDKFAIVEDPLTNKFPVTVSVVVTTFEARRSVVV